MFWAGALTSRRESRIDGSWLIAGTGGCQVAGKKHMRWTREVRREWGSRASKAFARAFELYPEGCTNLFLGFEQESD